MQSANGYGVIEHGAPFIQSCPERLLIGPALANERLVGHGLMSALNGGVIGGSADARKDHLNTQRHQPQMQAGGKRRGGRVIEEHGIMIQRKSEW